MKNTLFIMLLLGFLPIKAQNFKPYQFYDKKGKEIKTERLVKELADYDVVFFGENHNNSINH